ncbi:MAG: 4-hydroxythreonine-4-phosphate dehydrogenase PdxA [Pseudomonadota bacterium]
MSRPGAQTAAQRGACTVAPLALTAGEPGGVGGEIAVKAWRALKASGPVFFVIDAPERLADYGAPVTAIDDAAAAPAVFAEALPVLPLTERVRATPGRADPENAAAVVAAIDTGVALTLAGDAAAVVTNPVQKSSLYEAGFKFPGHTEYLAALTRDVPAPEPDAPRGPVMMLAAPGLRTVPATVHQALATVPGALSVEGLTRIGRVIDAALRLDFGIDEPRLALAGLNPHAGESGALGREEIEIVAPAAAALRAAGVDAFGPVAADSLFHDEARAKFDAALCMYHDQALIPVKTLDFHRAVNVTLGLPIVRTSPDHGAALDIAGTGRARADSLIAALQLAAQLAARRLDRRASPRSATL